MALQVGEGRISLELPQDRIQEDGPEEAGQQGGQPGRAPQAAFASRPKDTGHGGQQGEEAHCQHHHAGPRSTGGLIAVE